MPIPRHDLYSACPIKDRVYSFLPRYDVILLFCLIAQLLMLMLRLETLTELRVICLFHVIGIGLEIYKVHMGSWSYPEEAYTKIFGFRSTAALCMPVWQAIFIRH